MALDKEKAEPFLTLPTRFHGVCIKRNRCTMYTNMTDSLTSFQADHIINKYDNYHNWGRHISQNVL